MRYFLRQRPNPTGGFEPPPPEYKTGMLAADTKSELGREVSTLHYTASKPCVLRLHYRPEPMRGFEPPLPDYETGGLAVDPTRAAASTGIEPALRLS